MSIIHKRLLLLLLSHCLSTQIAATSVIEDNEDGKPENATNISKSRNIRQVPPPVIFQRTSDEPTEEYFKATSAPFIVRGLTTWDPHGDLIINGDIPGDDFKQQFYVSDVSIYQPLLVSMMHYYNSALPTQMMPGWGRLAWCYVLANLRNEGKNKAFTTFDKKTECTNEKMFTIGFFKGNNAVKLKRLQHCYQNDEQIKGYTNCLVGAVQDEIGQLKSNNMKAMSKEICSRIIGHTKFLNSKKGSHVREICFNNAEVILRDFTDELEKRNKLHVVQPFEIELCWLGTYFRPGKMTICFPYNDEINPNNAKHMAEFAEYGPNQFLTVEFANPNQLDIYFGSQRHHPYARASIFTNFRKGANEITCKRLAFNRYKLGGIYKNKLYKISSDGAAEEEVWMGKLPSDEIPVPMDYITVKGKFGKIGDNVTMGVVNTFQRTFFFFRIGRSLSTIKCYYGYAPTSHFCQNKEGTEKKDCAMQIQTSIQQTTGSENSLESSSEIKDSVAAEMGEKIKLSASHDETHRTSAAEKFMESLLQGMQLTRNIEFSAGPGEVTELWQQAYTCFNVRTYLPFYEQKKASSERNNYPESEYVGASASMYEGYRIDDQKHRGAVNNVDWGAKLPLSADYGGDISFIPLHKGPCDHPYSAAYNESECNFIKLPQDLLSQFEDLMNYQMVEKFYNLENDEE